MLLGEHGSAKEVILSAQEALERLENTEISDDAYLPPLDQLLTLIDANALGTPSQLCICMFMEWNPAIPRLKLRRKTAPATLQPLVAGIVRVARAHGEGCSTDQGRSIIQRICKFVQAANSWVKAVADSSEEHSSCNVSRFSLVGCSTANELLGNRRF